MSTPNSTPALVAQLAERDQCDAYERELEVLAACPDCRSVVIALCRITGDMRHVLLTTWHERGCPNQAGQLGRLPRT